MSILLSKARPGQCRWIVCDAVGDKRDIFGGRRVCGAATAWPSSYCMEHRLRVYARTETTAPAPPQEFTLQRRAPQPETLPDLVEILS